MDPLPGCLQLWKPLRFLRFDPFVHDALPPPEPIAVSRLRPGPFLPAMDPHDFAIARMRLAQVPEPGHRLEQCEEGINTGSDASGIAFHRGSLSQAGLSLLALS